MPTRLPAGTYSLPPGVDIAALLAALTGESGSAPSASVNVNTTMHPLLNAAASDEVSEARAALARGADPNLPDAADGWGPLHYAVNMGSMRVLQLLLAHPGVNVDMQSRSRMRPLDACPSPEAARALLDAGATIAAPAPGCLSALHNAAYTSRDTVVDVLLARGANVRETFSARKESFGLGFGGEALHLAASALKSARALNESTQCLAALCNSAGSAHTNAHTTASRRVAVVIALLRAGADVNARATTLKTGLQPTALHLAAASGDAAVIRALLAGGASVDAVDTFPDKTALLVAAHEGHTDAIYALVAGGADVSPVCDDDEMRPLEAAILQNRPAAVTALLELGADTSQVARCLATPKVDDAMRALLARFVACGRAPPPARECGMPGCQARRRAAYDDAKLMICAACKVRLLGAHCWARGLTISHILQTVAYCCKEHQRKHWPAHKAACNAARNKA